MPKANDKHPDSDLIDKLGGTTKAATFLDVKAPSISEWRKTGLPKARMMFLKLARPDLFSAAARMKFGRRKEDRQAKNSRT